MEIILYDDVLPKLVCFSLSNFVKNPSASRDIDYNQDV